MHRVKKLLISLVVTALILSYASFAFSAAYVSISSSGNGVFDLQGNGFVGVSAAKVVITYDTATLSNPQVEQGGLMAGGLMAPNTMEPGSITLGFISPTFVTGSGSLATIRFGLPGRSLGSIQSVSLQLIDSSAHILPVQQAVINNPVGVASGQETTPTNRNNNPQYPETITTPAEGTGSGSSNVVGGTVTIPGEGETFKSGAKGTPAVDAAEQQRKEASDTSGSGDAADKASTGTASTGETDKQQNTRPTNYQSVLERFRTYTGSSTVQALVALFGNDLKGIRQEPPVALSDGVTPVTIIISQPAEEKEAPNFAFRNAKYRSLKMSGENSWAVEVLPDKGASEAAVKMLHHGALTEVPLTIAPPLPASVRIGTGGTLTEADFAAFLKERGTAKSPRFDLNGDGKRDYLDDYIFTANYLVKRDSRKKATVKEQK